MSASLREKGGGRATETQTGGREKETDAISGVNGKTGEIACAGILQHIGPITKKLHS